MSLAAAFVDDAVFHDAASTSTYPSIIRDIDLCHLAGFLDTQAWSPKPVHTFPPGSGTPSGLMAHDDNATKLGVGVRASSKRPCEENWES